MSKFDDLITMAGRYATARVEASRGHILHDEAQEYSEEFCTAVRLLEAEHKALLDDQEELVRVRAELAAIRALEPAGYFEVDTMSWRGNELAWQQVFAPHGVPLYALPEQKK